MSDDEKMPKEPMAPMTEMFSSVHEMYSSMRESGFTSWEACRIIGVYIAEVGKQQ